MNEKQHKIISELREMESSEAAEWLIKTHPKDGCIYISKVSWRKPDQLVLANHFLSYIPHTSGRCYAQLLAIMSLPKFVAVLEKYIPKNNQDKDLLSYCLLPCLNKAAKTEKDHLAIQRIQGML